MSISQKKKGAPLSCTVIINIFGLELKFTKVWSFKKLQNFLSAVKHPVNNAPRAIIDKSIDDFLADQVKYWLNGTLKIDASGPEAFIKYIKATYDVRNKRNTAKEIEYSTLAKKIYELIEKKE